MQESIIGEGFLWGDGDFIFLIQQAFCKSPWKSVFLFDSQLLRVPSFSLLSLNNL